MTMTLATTTALRTSSEASTTTCSDRAALPVRVAKAEPASDVLDVDDGVVDDLADGDHQAGQDHRIDRAAEGDEHDGAGQHRERDRQRADERRPPVGQKRDEDGQHQETADAHRAREVQERLLDERRRPKDR
jgi:hypothetical protein